MLESIEIKGFKSIKDQKVELRPLNVLIGANGAGKSNFIQVFDFLRNIVHEELQIFTAKKGGADKLLYFGRKQTEEIYVKLKFGQNGYMCRIQPTDEDYFTFVEEYCSFLGSGHSEPFIDPLGSGQIETNLNERLQRPKSVVAQYVIDGLKSWGIYHFQDTSESAKVKSTNDINDNAYFRYDAANLAPYLYLLREKHPDYYKEIVSIIKLVAPFFEDFILRPTPMNENKIMLEWKEKNSDMYFNAHSFSDGTLRFICLAVLLMQPTEYLPSTILIDEPEIGLHPYSISILAAMMRKAAAETQVIVSTQSVTLLNQFTPEDIIVVDREDSATEFRRFTEDEIATWLDDYSMGDLWEKNVLGGRP